MYSTRLILFTSFLATLIIFGGVLSYGLTQFEIVRDKSNEIVTNNNTKSDIILTMVNAARERVLDLYAMISSDDPFIRDVFFLDFNKQGAIFARSRVKLLSLKLSDDEIQILERQGELTGVSVPIQNRMVDMIQNDNIEEARILLNEQGVEAQNKVLEQLGNLINLQKSRSKEIISDIDTVFKNGRDLIFAWSFAAFILGGLVAAFVISKTGKIEKKLETINSTLEKRVEDRTLNLEQTNIHLQESLDSLGQAQEDLIHAEKMAALGGLVAGISHEINTPIGISVTSATNIEEKVLILEKSFLSGKLTQGDFEVFTKNSLKGLNILIKNLRIASDLIRSFKQVAVDQSTDELREFELFSYCNEIILSLHPKLKTTNIIVNNQIPENINMFSNPGALYQIISNLIMNSIRHAFDESSNDKKINITAAVEDDKLHLVYSDTGNGATKDVLAKIFEPFFTTKRGQGGSGLGMNVVYNLVTTTLQGQVEAISKPNEGLCISMILPMNLEGDL